MKREEMDRHMTLMRAIAERLHWALKEGRTLDAVIHSNELNYAVGNRHLVR